MKNLFSFFFFLLHFGHSFSSLLLCSPSNSGMCACPRFGTWSSWIVAPHSLPHGNIIHLYISTYHFYAHNSHTCKTDSSFVSKVQTCTLNLSNCLFWKPLNVNIPRTELSLPPLATSILSVNHALNLGITFVSTLSFAVYTRTSPKSHIYSTCAPFGNFL